MEMCWTGREGIFCNVPNQMAAKPGVAEAGSKWKGMKAFNLSS